MIPPAKRGGNARTVDLRAVVNGLLHVLGTGCQWRAIPKDLPPRSTLHGYFMRWEWDGTLERIHHALYVRCREQAGRDSSPEISPVVGASGSRIGKSSSATKPCGDAGEAPDASGV